MAQIVIECPACKKAVQASTGFFAKKKLKCSCGYLIDVNMERMTETDCPHCGNKVIYDRKDSASASCPVCHTKINAGKETVKITCPACKTELTADKSAKTYTCPMCKTLFDVQARVMQEKNSGKTAVIKWDMGMNDIFVYRHPIENFNIGSQLIVSEGQKAIFFRNGQGLDVFGPGRHILETQKLPLLEEIAKLPTDTDATFDSKVYFVRTNRLNVKWGVSGINLKNPEMDFYVTVGVGISCDIQILEDNESARKLLYMIKDTATSDKGNEPMGAGESYTATYISKKFEEIATSRISDLLANIIIENQINVLDLDRKRIVISEILRKDYNQILEEYGLFIPQNHFSIARIKIDETEDVKRWKQQEADRSVKTREEKLQEDILKASQGRIRAEEENIAMRNILHAQGEGETLKVSARAEAEVGKIAAQGRSDAKLIDVETEAKAVRISTLGEADAMRIKAQAEGESESLRAPGQAEAMVTIARAEGESSKQRAIGDSEAIRMMGGAEADAYRLQAIAEADEMRAKGYTYAQETSREIGLEAMKNGLPGTGNGGGNGSSGGVSGSLGNLVGLGLEIGAMGAVVDMTKETIAPMMEDLVNAGKRDNGQNNQGWSCACGKSGITSKFCPDCGSPMPVVVPPQTWHCSCGCMNITSKFCPNCGKQSPFQALKWDCPSCGCKDITSNFCPDCGQKKV